MSFSAYALRSVQIAAIVDRAALLITYFRTPYSHQHSLRKSLNNVLLACLLANAVIYRLIKASDGLIGHTDTHLILMDGTHRRSLHIMKCSQGKVS